MQIARLLCLVTIYTSIMVLDLVDADRVGPMNELLSNSGWLQLDTGNEPLRVIERWMETEQPVNIRQLLLLSVNGQIVTKDNVDCKIRLAHQFLSCKYAEDFKKYCEYERGIVHQCSRVVDPSESLEFFKRFFKDLIEINDRIVPRMRGALFCFYELSPKTVHNRDVFKILGDFKNYYNAKQFEATSSETSSVLEAQIEAIEKHMFNTIELLSVFYNSNCSPIGYDEVNWNESSTRKYVEVIRDTPSYAMHSMRQEVKIVVDKFITAHYELLGFEYNTEWRTTRIDYDPETIPRVNKMNALLSFPGWSITNTSEIIVDNGRFIKVDYVLYSPDGPIVNKKNVGEKMRQVHQILSCEYIIVMKKCHDQLLGIANECIKEFTADCWKNFWIIVKQIDPMVLHMRGSLFYFYQLSPQTEYIKGIYEILGELKNYYDSVDLSNSWLSKTKNLIKMKLWKMKTLTEKINPLFDFFKRNCWTSPPIFHIPPPRDSGLTLPRRSDEFNRFLYNFIQTTYGSFGFTYNLESDTTTIIRIENSDNE